MKLINNTTTHGTHYVYHISDTDDLSTGYIGVTSNLSARAAQHRSGQTGAHEYIISHPKCRMVVIASGNKNDMFILEEKYRPEPYIGANKMKGGARKGIVFSTEHRAALSKPKSVSSVKRTRDGSSRIGKQYRYQYDWVTPHGTFSSSYKASKCCGISPQGVQGRCLSHTSLWAEWSRVAKKK